jgi:outer membrane lipoprotein-sorting protein
MKTRLCLISLCVLMTALRAAAAATTPAISAFDHAFAKIDSYTVKVRAYEVLGTQTQVRVYQYWFKKPDLAKTAILSGPGAGGGGVWKGGDTVSGHRGGMLSFLHLTISIHDPRATSLRGYTIPEGLLQNEVDEFKEIPGTLSQHDGPSIDGAPTDEVDLDVSNPAANGGVVRMQMYLNKVTHWPVRQVRLGAGNQILADATFYDLQIDPGLKDSDF